MAVWNDGNLRQEYWSTLQQRGGETTMIGHSTSLLLCMPSTVRHHDFRCLLRKHRDRKLLTIVYVNKHTQQWKSPFTVLHQNSAWIEIKASHHRDTSTVRGMDLIWIGMFRVMSEKPKSIPCPLILLRKAQSFLLQSKHRTRILISPWYGYVPAWRRLAQTQSSSQQRQRYDRITGV